MLSLHTIPAEKAQNHMMIKYDTCSNKVLPSPTVYLISILASRRKQEQKPTSSEVHHLLIIFVQQLLVFSPEHDLEVRPFFCVPVLPSLHFPISQQNTISTLRISIKDKAKKEQKQTLAAAGVRHATVMRL
jgi:hypothetical protein